MKAAEGRQICGNARNQEGRITRQSAAGQMLALAELSFLGY